MSSSGRFDRLRAVPSYELSGVVAALADDVDAIGPVDLVLDTVGGELVKRAAELLANGRRLVSVAEEPPGDGTYFVVEPSPEQLIELARLLDSGELRVAIDSTFALSEAAAAFERSLASGKHGKVVIHVAAG
jgi:NADPH:quinone reductase-like Zn-dependent oxidoreductase